MADEDLTQFEVRSNVERMELYSDGCPLRLSLRISNFDSEADYKKFINNCMMLTRRCQEYKLWKGYLIDVLGANHCMVTNEVITEVTIDVHHHVPSMHALICALVNRHIEKNEEFCTLDIAAEAINLHFMNKVGYVTLAKTMHEKFHNGYLDIPIGMVRGDYKSFLERYSKYLDEEDLETIQKRLATTESNATWSRDNYPMAAEG